MMVKYDDSASLNHHVPTQCKKETRSSSQILDRFGGHSLKIRARSSQLQST